MIIIFTIFHDILSGYSEARLLMGMPIEAKLNGIMKNNLKLCKFLRIYG